MPFLFEAVADESELLLPENLTKTDSLIRDLVASVPDEDWDHIEIIGFTSSISPRKRSGDWGS